MTKLIPDPKAPQKSADYLYAERMDGYEESINFFLDKDVSVEKEKVKEEDLPTVDGLESIITRFKDYGRITIPFGKETSLKLNEHAGTESIADTARAGLDFIIQLVKDAVYFILNFVNNRIARVDGRNKRTVIERKRSGLNNNEVRYPGGMRRLVDRTTISEDPNWVNESLKMVHSWYKDNIKVYKDFSSHIKIHGEGFDIKSAVEDVTKSIKVLLGMEHDPANDRYITKRSLPGNKLFSFNVPNPSILDSVGLYFVDTAIDVPIPTKTFYVTSPMMDKTLAEIKDIISSVRSNQSTVSQLIRDFEKSVTKFKNENASSLSTDEKTFFNWLIRVNKRLMNLCVQYVIAALDTALDFCNAGIGNEKSTK